jgi:asparagine synthase (glutamine-hydrolysing)
MLPEALQDMDHPSGDGLNTWLISKVTKESGITMALSGLGGDELFGGYDLFKRLYLLEKFRFLGSIPKSLRKIPSKLLDLGNPSVAIFKAKEILNLPGWDIQHTYPVMRQSIPDNIIMNLLSLQKLPENRVFEIVKCHLQGYTYKNNDHSEFKPDSYAHISLAELATYLQNILLRDTDQMSMAHALEVRVPFLDFELVEYILQVKSDYKFTSLPKQLLAESMGKLLPKEIYQRKKMGFVFPWDHWMRNELKGFCEEKLQKLEVLNIFDVSELMKLWSRFLCGDPLVSWSRVWHLVVLSEWVQNNRVEG